MLALEIIKNIYVNPRRAFARESLDETLHQALVAYFVFVVVGSTFVLSWMGVGSPAAQQSFEKYPWILQHLGLCYFGLFLIGIPLLFSKIWLLRYFTEKHGATVAFKSLLSAECWIVIATLIPDWLLGLLSYRTDWIILICNWVLMAFCVQALTGFSFKRSAGILLQTALTGFGLLVGVILALMVVIIQVAIRPH